MYNINGFYILREKNVFRSKQFESKDIPLKLKVVVITGIFTVTALISNIFCYKKY
jgi:hypothetical protein